MVEDLLLTCHFVCPPAKTASFSSFEVKMIRVEHLNPFSCILIHHASGPNSSFLNKFRGFLSSVFKLYRLDFNIHVDVVFGSFVTNFVFRLLSVYVVEVSVCESSRNSKLIIFI